MDAIQRLHETIAAVAPIRGVSVGADDSISINFDDAATTEQREAAQNALNAFDSSPQAQAAWELEKRRQEAIAWLDSDTKDARAVRSVLLVVMGEIRALKADTPLPTRSWTELKEYVANLIATGAGDLGYNPDGA